VEALLPLPAGALTKTQMEDAVEVWLNGQLIDSDPAPLYVKLKQLEFAVKGALEKLNEQAFNDAGQKFGGLNAGTIYGQRVELSYPKRWQYSPAITELVEEQKTALEVAQKLEQQAHTAEQVTGKGVIRVTIRP
jgi:hypothetical protein